MSGVGTLILGRPRPLSRHRRAEPYTLNCESRLTVRAAAAFYMALADIRVATVEFC